MRYRVVVVWWVCGGCEVGEGMWYCVVVMWWAWECGTVKLLCGCEKWC